MKESELCKYCKQNIKDKVDLSKMKNKCYLCGYGGKV